MRQTLTLNHIVTRSEQAAAEALHDEKIILDLNTGEYFGTGSVGGFIWDELAAPRSLDSVARAVCTRFDIEQQTSAADVLAFVDELVERGLAKIVASA